MNRDEAAALRDDIERKHNVYPRRMETALLCRPDGWVVRVTTDSPVDIAAPGVEVIVTDAMNH